MSNVPLPEPAFSLRWERGEHKVSPPMDDCDCYTADQMHAYAASVSAAKDAEISRLKHRIALHDPCNGRMAGEPPRYTPECVVLRAEVAGLREDAERYRWLRDKQAYIGIHPHYKDLPIEQRSGWTIRLVPDVKNSFDAAIDAARKGEA